MGPGNGGRQPAEAAPRRGRQGGGGKVGVESERGSQVGCPGDLQGKQVGAGAKTPHRASPRDQTETQ